MGEKPATQINASNTLGGIVRSAPVAEGFRQDVGDVSRASGQTLEVPSHGRYGYSAIVSRPDFSWPEGKRLAVYVGLNLEHFAFGNGLGAELCPGGPQPDVLNYAWRDYGNRVGVWRLIDLFDELSLPVSVLANSSIYTYCPEVMDAFRARGAEVVGHGRTNSERQGILPQAQEQLLIEECT